MSTFTVTVAELIDANFDFGLGPNDYPIYDEAEREALNRTILDHYMNYEIGQETDAMFKFALNRRMREIMPYYNELYKTTKIHYDPLVTIDFTDAAVSESESTSNASNTNENETRSQARAVNMELPQVRLSGDEDYATSSADTVSDSSATAAGEATGSETANGTVTHTVNGRQGSAANLIMEFRAALLNIDMLVVSELNNLFMGVWDNGDEYGGAHRLTYSYYQFG